MEKFIENFENTNNVQNQSINPTAEGEMQQASAGASPVKIDASEPVIVESHSAARPAPSSGDGEGGNPKKPKKAVKKDYKPVYSVKKKEELDYITEVAKESIKSIINNPEIGAVPFNDNHNFIVNLTAAYKSGINILKPTCNRLHGKDKMKTGDSIRTYGAQRPLLVITKEVADAAEIKVERFPNDKRTGELKELDLVVEDGCGRWEYVLGLEEGEMPTLWATFIEPDSLGYYNPSKVMEVINTELTIWKTPEHLQKLILEEGQDAHEGWELVQELYKKGYMYQAACMAYTLDTDRIKKREVNNEDAGEVFAYIESAKKIHEALVEKFKEGEDKTLKTKEFPKEVSILWRKLKDFKNDEDWATDTFVEFINQFKESKVHEILNAKNVKGEMNKDEVRKKILNEQFNQFIGRKGIDLD